MHWKLVIFTRAEESSALASDLRSTIFEAYFGRQPPARPVLYRNGPASGIARFFIAPEAAALVPEYLSALNASTCDEPDLISLIPLLLAPQS